MISLFKRVRKKYLNSGKIGKYLLYALGEIVLVIAGILIALAINNVVENRNQIQQANNYLDGIVNDLKSDTTLFGQIERQYNSLQKFDAKILNTSDLNQVSLESLERLTWTYSNLQPVNNKTFEKLKSIGLTNLTNEGNLQSKIDEYYTSTAANFQKMVNSERAQNNRNINYWTHQNHFEMDVEGLLTVQDSVQKRAGLIEMISSPFGRNMLKEEYYQRSSSLNNLRNMKKRATKLIKAIQQTVK